MLSSLPPKSFVSSAADAGVALTLGIAGTFVFALPRFSLCVNDRDAVLDAMVCCLFVVFLKFFRKALKRVLLDLTYERYNNVWLTDQNFCQDSKKRMDGAERHKSGATYHKQRTGEHVANMLHRGSFDSSSVKDKLRYMTDLQVSEVGFSQAQS